MEEVVRLGTPVFVNSKQGPGDCGRRIAVTFDDGFRSVAENALTVMVQQRVPSTIFVPTGYFGQRAGWITNPHHQNFNETVLSEQEIKSLPNAWICIGSHCVSHRNLSQLHDEEITAELEQSKRTLESILDKPLDVLSLPYGGFSDRVLELAQQAGYDRIFLNVPMQKDSNRFGNFVGRINVSPQDWPLEFKLKARGAYQWLPVAIAIKRGLRRLCEAVRGLRNNIR
jgi:peptidoglycan/xylan/chitin deacetylase (PgdA/CDA1 family)